ncbi:MAG: histidine kinase [Candidatus Sulfotelmatobacter sp.]
MLWTRIRIVFKRDELGFPSFRQLQLMGWSGFYLLLLLVVLPYRKPGEFWDETVCCALWFLGSCLLRPVCRSLFRRSLPWLTLEVRAFAWSAALGVVATFISELALVHSIGRIWSDFLENWLQSTVVLFLWCTLYFSVKQWQQAARERERLLRAEAEVRDARLSALRYQLNPHFLFNSLNAVSTLVLDGNAPAATRMLAQIGELLRTTLDSDGGPETPLSQEIAFTERYLAIEQTRLGGRLRVEITISPETLDALVPSMLLQPLVENAVRHGVAPLVEGGTIRVQSKLHGAQLQISVQNSGDPRAGLAQKNQPANGIGLSNTAERLKTLYATDHKFLLKWPEAGGCEVTVELPLRKIVEQQGALACAR